MLNIGNIYVYGIDLLLPKYFFCSLTVWNSGLNGRIASVVIGRNQVNNVSVVILPAIFSSTENETKLFT